MKTIKRILGFLVAVAMSPLAMAQPEEPNGAITPRTSTIYVNQAWNNNGLNSIGVAITSNGDVVAAWEDDNTPSYAIRHWAAVWTVYDKDGNLLTPVETITNGNPGLASVLPSSIDTSYRSFFRNDGTPIPGRSAWGPKLKANPFGPGFGMGGVSYAVHAFFSGSGTNGLGNEIEHLLPMNLDSTTTVNTTNAAGEQLQKTAGAGFAGVQLVNNDGTMAAPALAGGSAADYDPPGEVRIGDFHYLANGNVVIVNESRQAADRALTGQTGGNVVTYRVLRPDGTEVKGWSAVSTAGSPSEMWHGVAVTANGFAIRFRQDPAQRATMRLFDNDGNPTSDNIDLGNASEVPELAGGGRGDGVGFQGNGTDAYVHANSFGGTAWVGVFNTDGSLRWARQVGDEGNLPNTDRMDAAIAPDGRVVVIFDATNQYPGETNRVIFGRMFSPIGEPVGPIFRVSEKTGEYPPGAFGFSRHPRVAWRNGLLAVVWESHGNSDVTANRILGLRVFDAPALPIQEPVLGLAPKTDTVYVNQTWNNNGLNSLGVAITSNGDVVVGWEDDNTPSYAIRHWAAVWTLYDKNGNLITPVATITNGNPGLASVVPSSIDTSYRSFFRNDGTPIPGRSAWGPKIKANPFGPGFGMGAVSYAVNAFFSASGTNGLGNEIAHLLPINLDSSTTVNTTNAAGEILQKTAGGAFAGLQLVNNDGTMAAPALAGGTAADYDPPGDVRIGDWHYLANGNIVIANQSGQVADRALTGQAGGNVVTYRVVKPDGTEIKAWSAASSEPGPSDMWHGVGVTANGFAIRWGFNGRATMRLFDNNGNPTSDNIDLGIDSGVPELNGGGRGDGVGFQGNGTDAYVHAASFGGTAWVGVFNADGSLRWGRRVADGDVLPNTDRVDAAIAADGRVVVIFDASNQFEGGSGRVILGRIFNRNGAALGPTFRVSEKEGEYPPAALGFSQRPRVAWREGLIAVVWEAHGNSDITANRIVGTRFFQAPYDAPILINSVAIVGGEVQISWEGGTPPFAVRKKTTISGDWSEIAAGLTDRTFTDSISSSPEGYYQVTGQ